LEDGKDELTSGLILILLVFKYAIEGIVNCASNKAESTTLNLPKYLFEIIKAFSPFIHKTLFPLKIRSSGFLSTFMQKNQNTFQRNCHHCNEGARDD
jgi:hypothetical protein